MSRRIRITRSLPVAVCSLSFLVACSDPDGDMLTGGGDKGATASNTPGAGGPVVEGGFRRLTRGQYENALVDLLQGNAQFSPDLAEVKVNLTAAQVDYATEVAARTGYAPADVDALYDSAMSSVGPIFDDAGKRTKLMGCDPTDVADPCVVAFIKVLGRRAFRRALDDGEVGRYVAVATSSAAALKSVPKGIGFAVAAIVQSPSFLYVTESGEPDPTAPGQTRYTSREMATRLAFAITGSTPDDTLLAAGEQGDLTDEGKLRAAIGSLIASDHGRKNVIAGFFGEYFQLYALDGMGRDASLYPTWNAGMAASMAEELRRDLDDGIFVKDEEFGQLFTSRTTFIDATLAGVYGLPSPASGFVATTIPADWARVGILGTGAFLAVNSKGNRSSPTLRGKAIAARFYCQDVPQPPPDIKPLPDNGGTTATTTRDKLAAHRNDPSCSGCHNIMDPPGLALEHFDAIGSYREKDVGLPIDASGTLAGVPFDGLTGLSAILATSAQLNACMTKHAFRYLAGRQPDAAAVDPLTNVAHGHIKALVTEVAASAGFRNPPPAAK